MTQATDWQQHSVRGFLAGGEEEAWFLADHFESGRRRPPLPHRDASRSLTWPSRRLISRSRWRGFPPRRSSNCAASGGGFADEKREALAKLGEYCERLTVSPHQPAVTVDRNFRGASTVRRISKLLPVPRIVTLP